jgi:hypothetical protein
MSLNGISNGAARKYPSSVTNRPGLVKPNQVEQETVTSKERVRDSYEQVEQVYADNSAIRVNFDKTLGKTVGDVQLSEEAESYYNQLKQKYGSMDFVLVSKDMKESAKANAGAFATSGKMVVLIDEEKIEKMATDSNYRAKYENIISNAQNELLGIKNQVGENDLLANFGMKVNDDGSTSFFAVFNRSQQEAREQLAALQEKKAAQRKADEKARAKKAAEMAEQEKRAEKKAEAKEAEEKAEAKRLEARQAEEEPDEEFEDEFEIAYMGEEYEVLYADSAEELLEMIRDYTARSKSGNISGLFAGSARGARNFDFSA